MRTLRKRLHQYGCTVFRDGRVWVHPYTGKDGRKAGGKFAAQPKTSAGYALIHTCKKRMYLHRLLAEAFLIRPEHTTEVNHIDGNKSNNALSNLEWVTRKQNSQHAYDTGLKEALKGSETDTAKLTEGQVYAIKKLLAEVIYSQRQIAKIFNVSREPIDSISRNLSWKHVHYP